MSIGDVLINTLVSLEDGDKTNASVDFKIKSTDFRRFLTNLGKKTDNMNQQFEKVGQRIQEIFIQHFDSDSGPDRNGNLISWDPYSERGKPGTNWIDRKLRSSDNEGGSKLMHYTGRLRNSLEKGGEGNIHVVTKTRIEIGTEVEYAHFNQFGFNAKNKYGSYDTENLTRRPIFGLTDEESEEVAHEVFAEEFFKDL